MTDAIVDTNVMIVANRQNGEIAPNCIDNCVEFLVGLQKSGVLILDSSDQVRLEYAQAISQGRPYQLGAQFLIHVYRNQFNEKHVKRVEISVDKLGNYIDFPSAEELEKFDLSDRKFAALSRKTGVPVTNAVDSDWVDFYVPLKESGIDVNFLCGCDKAAWITK